MLQHLHLPCQKNHRLLLWKEVRHSLPRTILLCLPERLLKRCVDRNLGVCWFTSCRAPLKIVVPAIFLRKVRCLLVSVSSPLKRNNASSNLSSISTVFRDMVACRLCFRRWPNVVYLLMFSRLLRSVGAPYAKNVSVVHPEGQLP